MSVVAKGTDLEQRIESFFRLNNYETQRNVILEGRSGAPHEIDVYAKKHDGVTDVSVAVECKAWEAPIEKDIVSKLSMELADLGINKGIIVCLRGFTTGAEMTAKQLGIELWGTDDIRNKLGQVAVAEISAAGSLRTGRGFAATIEEAQLSPRLIATARGFLGFGREELVWLKSVSLPFWLVELDHSRRRSTFLKGTVMETTKRWNLYEALSGSFHQFFDAAPQLSDLPMPSSLPPRTNTRKLERDINDTIKKAQTVVRQSTQARYESKLLALGVPGDAEAVHVLRTEIIYVPFSVALLRANDGYRVIAVDAVWGRRSRPIDHSLSENVSFVTDVLGADVGPEAGMLAAARRSSRPGVLQIGVVAGIGVLEFLLFQQNAWLLPYAITIAFLIFLAYMRWRREEGF